MATSDIEYLARQVVALQRAQSAATKATQLPSTSVRLVDGTDAYITDGIEASIDLGVDVGMISDQTESITDIADSLIDYTTDEDDWRVIVAETGTIGWDLSEYAADLANQIEIDLDAAKADLANANLQLDKVKTDLEAAQQDLIAAQEDIAGAVAVAGTKSRVHYKPSTDGPSLEGNAVGDTWFVTDDSNKIRTWDGTAWVDKALGTNAFSDLAITDAKIATLDAAKITTGYLNADRIESLSITTGKLAAGAITTDKLTANAVTADKIAANTITAREIAALSITGDKLVANSITGDKIVANTITGDKLMANSVEAIHLKADAIDGRTIRGVTIEGGTLSLMGLSGTGSDEVGAGPTSTQVARDRWYFETSGSVSSPVTWSTDGQFTLTAKASKPGSFVRLAWEPPQMGGIVINGKIDFSSDVPAYFTHPGTGLAVPMTAGTWYTIEYESSIGMWETGLVLPISNLDTPTISVRRAEFKYESTNESYARLFRTNYGAPELNLSQGGVDDAVIKLTTRDLSIETQNERTYLDEFGLNLVSHLTDHNANFMLGVDGNATLYASQNLNIDMPAGAALTSSRGLKALWTGAWFVGETQTVNFRERLSAQVNGIILEFKRYTGGAVANEQMFYAHIPKSHGANNAGRGVMVNVPTWDSANSGKSPEFKYFYVRDTNLSGHAANGTGLAANHVLTAVYGY